MADGTVINATTATGGDTIATEELAATASGGARLKDGLPVTAYKVPRSKIAVGSYDEDAGDASPTNPLAVGTLSERRSLETMDVAARDAASATNVRRCFERSSMSDRRGSDRRGVR